MHISGFVLTQIPYLPTNKLGRIISFNAYFGLRFDSIRVAENKI